MTRLANDPKRFATDVLQGFAAAHPECLMDVHGGVVRSTVVEESQVAVVLGGGRLLRDPRPSRRAARRYARAYFAASVSRALHVSLSRAVVPQVNMPAK